MQTGERIRDYVLLEKVGDGGMGEVWKAEHAQIKRVDAIKILRDSVALRQEAKDRFLNEAELQGRMRHPNIVAVYGAFEEKGASCIVMQYVDGDSLEHRLHRKPLQLLPLPEVLSISTDVLAALEYAHTFPTGAIVHRDVKPSNILLDRSGRALLTDFGIAFALGGNRYTQAGTTLGTVYYMSPEQIQDPRTVNAKSDIYSFGCVLYELLAGRPPFGAETDTDFTIKSQHIKEMPTPIRTWNAHVPFDFEWIVYKALNKDPAMRFASCAEMSRALANAFATHMNTAAGGVVPLSQRQTGPQPIVTTQPAYVSPITSSSKNTPPPGNVSPITTVSTITPPPLVVVGPGSGGAGQPPPRRRTLLWVGLALLLLLLALGAFFFKDRLMTPSEEIILTLKGSTSVGDQLAPKMAEAFLRDQLKAEKTGSYVAKRDEKGRPYVHVWGDVPGKGREVIEIYATGSGDAFKCLAAPDGPDHCDLGMSSRPFNEGDRKASPSLPNLSGPANEHVIALDGIAMIVNPANPVSRLSIQQLRDLYTGQITNWKQVGGDDAPVDLYGRDKASGTREMFEQMVVGKDKQGKPIPVAVPDGHDKGESSEIVDAVLKSPNAIGYVSSPLAKGAKALAVSDGTSAALRPSDMAIVSEDYPINRRLFLYEPNNPTSMAGDFIVYAVNEKGQAVVTAANYAGLTPQAFEVTDVPADAPERYKENAAGFLKLGLSFRFASGKASSKTDSDNQLDNLAADNIARLEKYLKKHPGTIDQMLLVGYADSDGGKESNQILAMQRAKSIANDLALDRWNVPEDHIYSLGLLMPVATNDTPEGKRRNRRVEVWVPKGTE